MIKKKTIDSVLKKFKKKSQKIVKNEIFTEFFYLNKERRVIEFFRDKEDNLILNNFLKEFLPKEIRDFCEFILYVDDEENEISTWYYEEEDLFLRIKINWGDYSQIIFTEIDIENFMVNIITDKELTFKNIDINLFNTYLVEFIVNQAKYISKTYKLLVLKNNKIK